MLRCSVIHSLQTTKNHNPVTDQDLTVNVHETF